MVQTRMEVVILQQEPAAQKVHRLIEDGLPGANPFAPSDPTLVVEIQRLPNRQRNVLMWERGSIGLEDLPPRPDESRRGVAGPLPLPQICVWGSVISAETDVGPAAATTLNADDSPYLPLSCLRNVNQRRRYASSHGIGSVNTLPFSGPYCTGNCWVFAPSRAHAGAKKPG